MSSTMRIFAIFVAAIMIAVSSSGAPETEMAELIIGFVPRAVTTAQLARADGNYFVPEGGDTKLNATPYASLPHTTRINTLPSTMPTMGAFFTGIPSVEISPPILPVELDPVVEEGSASKPSISKLWHAISTCAVSFSSRMASTLTSISTPTPTARTTTRTERAYLRGTAILLRLHAEERKKEFIADLDEIFERNTSPSLRDTRPELRNDADDSSESKMLRFRSEPIFSPSSDPDLGRWVVMHVFIPMCILLSAFNLLFNLWLDISIMRKIPEEVVAEKPTIEHPVKETPTAIIDYSSEETIRNSLNKRLTEIQNDPLLIMAREASTFK